MCPSLTPTLPSRRHLILSAEGIISDERLAWVSTTGKLPNEADEKEGEGTEEKDHNQ